MPKLVILLPHHEQDTVLSIRSRNHQRPAGSPDGDPMAPDNLLQSIFGATSYPDLER